MYIPERDVLKPRDPSITDDNDWEIFILSNAEVRDETTDELISLLHADAVSPVTVRGRLEPLEREQGPCLVRKLYGKPVDIEVSNVTRFAYALDESNGEIIIWAAGEAGWFEVRPARSYKEIFGDMQVSIKLLYFAADLYNGGKPSTEMVFQEYAEDDRFPCNDPGDAAQIFYKHRDFLIRSMMDRKEGVLWGHTSLYQHLRYRFPEDFQAIRDKKEGKTAPTQNGGRAVQTRSNATPSRPAQPPVKAAQAPRRQTSTPRPGPQQAPKKDGHWWKAFVVWELILKARDQGLVQPNHITLANIARVAFRKYELEDEEQASNHICSLASNIRYMMEHPKRRKDVKWTQQPLYEELANVNLPAATLRKASTIDLRKRKVPLDGSDDSDSSDSDSSASTPPAPRRGRAGKGISSVLRPRGKKFSSKGALRQANSQVVTIMEEEETEATDAGDLMELTSPIKRKGEETSTLRPRKRTSARLHDPPVSPSTSSSDEGEDARSENLPLRWKDPNANSKSVSPAFVPILRSAPIPTCAPNAPPNTFVCAFDGCVHTIYGADSPESQILIKEHYQLHASRQQEQLDVVIGEEQRSRLPVSNLIKRIREMADSQQSLLPGSPGQASSPMGMAALLERDFPAPIRQKH